MPAVRYRIVLREPSIFAALEGEPNSAVSYDFIPGSALRGMVIGEYIRTHKSEKFDPANDHIQRLFFSDVTRYLNAYIVEAETGNRSLPVPLSWVQPKDGTPIIYDTAVSELEADVTTKSVKGFVVTVPGAAYVTKPERVLNVHTQRARRGGGEGLLYRYDGLAAHQVFEGIILCDEADDAQELYYLLEGLNVVTIGGASNAGYGRVEIRMLDSNILTDWDEAVSASDTRQPILTLLSDAILRDDSGSYRPTLAALEQALGAEIAHVHLHLDTLMVGGFNRKWGLPLPQTPAVKRGSVITMKNANQLDLSVLRYGIGERRNDGFGRVALGWQAAGSLTMSKSKPAMAVQVVTKPSDLSEGSRDLWQQMHQRLNERQLEESWVSIAYESGYAIRGPVTKTQIARLRSYIADELRQTAPNTDVLGKFLGAIKGRAAGLQYERSHIAGKTLASWLQAPHFKELPSKPQERAYVMLRLVDAVLERAQKERANENA